MDKKIKNYQKILADILEEYASAYNRNTKEIEAQVICDYQGNHFQLLHIGWDREKYRFSVIFHFDIKNGKIWLQENRTDILIAKELVERGVPKDDIVLGFQPQEERKYSGYAVA